MALEQLTLETGLNKVEVALALLKEHEPPEGYYLAFSGGKDSVAIYDLAVKAGVEFDAHYCVSPIDPPQIYQFIKEHYPDVQWDYHARGWWKMVVKKGLPLRQARWCCKVIKEAGGENRVVVTRSRRAEGANRSKQKVVEAHRNPKIKKFFVRPIINFSNHDIWQYIRENNLPYCSLYDEGFKRLGCVLCPFSRDIERETLYFPKVANLWLLACNRIVEKWEAEGKEHDSKTGQELFDRWTSRK